MKISQQKCPPTHTQSYITITAYLNFSFFFLQCLFKSIQPVSQKLVVKPLSLGFQKCISCTLMVCNVPFSSSLCNISRVCNNSIPAPRLSEPVLLIDSDCCRNPAPAARLYSPAGVSVTLGKTHCWLGVEM